MSIWDIGSFSGLLSGRNSPSSETATDTPPSDAPASPESASAPSGASVEGGEGAAPEEASVDAPKGEDSTPAAASPPPGGDPASTTTEVTPKAADKPSESAAPFKVFASEEEYRQQVLRDAQAETDRREAKRKREAEAEEKKRAEEERKKRIAEAIATDDVTTLADLKKQEALAETEEEAKSSIRQEAMNDMLGLTQHAIFQFQAALPPEVQAKVEKKNYPGTFAEGLRAWLDDVHAAAVEHGVSTRLDTEVQARLEPLVKERVEAEVATRLATERPKLEKELEPILRKRILAERNGEAEVPEREGGTPTGGALTRAEALAIMNDPKRHGEFVARKAEILGLLPK